MSLKKMEFIEAARSLGLGNGRIIFRHLKEVDAAALAMTRTPQEVAQILRYLLTGTLPG